MCCIFLSSSLFLCLDLKNKAMWWDIWSMMNSYQDVPYIYQNNLSEKSKIMCVRLFKEFKPDSCTTLKIRGIPLKHPLPHGGRKKLRGALMSLSAKPLLAGTSSLRGKSSFWHALPHLEAKRAFSTLCAALTEVMSERAASFFSNRCPMNKDNEA